MEERIAERRWWAGEGRVRKWKSEVRSQNAEVRNRMQVRSQKSDVRPEFDYGIAAPNVTLPALTSAF